MSEKPQQTEPGTYGKNQRGSVFIYLAVLFGAAFLMLLLAYFVQRRSNEDAISDLRNSMNLSRQELLDEIRELEDQNAALEDRNAALNKELDIWKVIASNWEERYNEQVRDTNNIFKQYTDALSGLAGWENYWLLEQSYQAGEYEDCVAILLLENMSEYGSYTPNKEIADRREEIIQALIDRGLLPEDRHIRNSDYQDWIDAYNAKHPDHGPTGWANTNYDD